MEHWYTFQIVLHRKEEGTDKHEAHEYRDCTPAKIEEYRKIVWVQGLKIKQSPFCWELLSPFMIKSIYIIKQDRRFNPIDEKAPV